MSYEDASVFQMWKVVAILLHKIPHLKTFIEKMFLCKATN